MFRKGTPVDDGRSNFWHPAPVPAPHLMPHAIYTEERKEAGAGRRQVVEGLFNEHSRNRECESVRLITLGTGLSSQNYHNRYPPPSTLKSLSSSGVVPTTMIVRKTFVQPQLVARLPFLALEQPPVFSASTPNRLE